MALLARGLLRVRTFDLAAVPASERGAALRAQAVAWEPFTDPELRLAQSGDLGLVIAWDRNAVAKALRGAGIESDRLQMWPELLMREPLRDGLRLVEGVEGYEAECWTNGRLLSSRWWPALPDAADWQGFVRSLGALGAKAEQSAAQPPAALRLPLRAYPWVSVKSLSDMVGGASGGEILGWRVVLLICIAVSAAIAHQLWSARERAEALSSELRSLQSSSAETIAARDKAMQLAAESQQLAAVMGGVQNLELMQQVVQILPKDVLIREYDFETGRLRLGLDIPATLARSSLIQLLQDGGWLRDVREVKASASSGNTVLEMRVEGLFAPQLSAAAAASAPAAAASPLNVSQEPPKRGLDGQR
ncbi:MAG: hypothetical protein C0423_21620 [Methylibium sp.]|nr:hypothetical protein [Methylibium sp.]